MIPTLLQEIGRLGCWITCEGDRLKLHNPATLTSEHKERLREQKANIIELFKQQEQVREMGWLVYPYGIAYEKRVGLNSLVYMLREENGNYTVWRGTWKDKKSTDREKLVIENVDFKKAFEKANSYIEWFSKPNRYKKGA